jgi:hypothetical protein
MSAPDKYVHRAYAIFHRQLSPNDWNVEAAVKNGMLPKNFLIDGCIYIGYGKDALEARWDVVNECFYYMKKRWDGKFEEEIHYPGDSKTNFFIPMKIKKFKMRGLT